MAKDPLVELGIGQLRKISIAADIDFQFFERAGFRPVVAILEKAKAEAAEAVAGLCVVDVNKPEDIRKLQNITARYDELVRWIKELISEGAEAERETTDKEREELLDILMETPEGEREAISLGLVEGAPHDA